MPSNCAVLLISFYGNFFKYITSNKIILSIHNGNLCNNNWRIIVRNDTEHIKIGNLSFLKGVPQFVPRTSKIAFLTPFIIYIQLVRLPLSAPQLQALSNCAVKRFERGFCRPFYRQKSVNLF